MTTPLPRSKFEVVIDLVRYMPVVEAEQARADLEAENKRLREALEDIRVSTTDHDTMLKARAALEPKT